MTAHYIHLTESHDAPSNVWDTPQVDSALALRGGVTELSTAHEGDTPYAELACPRSPTTGMSTAHGSILDDNTQHTNAHATQLLRYRQQHQNTRSLLRQLFEEECFAKGDSAVKVCHKADALLGTLPTCVTAKALTAKDKRVAAEVLNIGYIQRTWP